MRATKEKFGNFLLTVKRDAKGRLVSAVTEHMSLRCEPDIPRGTLQSSWGSERSEKGRVTGSWLDLPYGHECDVDKKMRYDDWVDDSLRQLRSGVFFCRPRSGPPRGKLALEVMRYAVEHKLLARHVINLNARVTLKSALRVAGAAEKAEWRRWFERDRLEDYLQILDEKKKR